MKTPLRSVLLSFLLATRTSAAAAQDATRPLDQALRDPAVIGALARLDSATPRTAATLAELGAIIPPSGHEHDRAEAVARHMRDIGLADVTIDSTNSVTGRIAGQSGRALVFLSTLDDLASVADVQRLAPHPPTVIGDHVVGPGTNTSSTTAAMLAAAEALVRSGLKPRHEVVFAAVSQEETGLVGMKHLYGTWKPRALGVVDILGDGTAIVYGAITIHWWRVMARGPAGHTLLGGLPNVNQGIGRAVDRILQMPATMRISPGGGVVDGSQIALNVGTIQSGMVFNHKPDSGWFSVDIRSLDAGAVTRAEDSVKAILGRVQTETGITMALEPVQLTPGGQLAGAEHSPLVTTSQAIAHHLGVAGRLGNAGSSNMNVAIAGGTPAIGLGGDRGGRHGYADEFVDIPAMMRTARHVLLLAVTMGDAR